MGAYLTTKQPLLNGEELVKDCGVSYNINEFWEFYLERGDYS